MLGTVGVNVCTTILWVLVWLHKLNSNKRHTDMSTYPEVVSQMYPWQYKYRKLQNILLHVYDFVWITTEIVLVFLLWYII